MQDRDDSTVLRHVGTNLRRLRQAAGMSQATLAERSDVSRRTIINLESGGANVSLSSLDRLATALDTTFVTLVAEKSSTAASINETTWRGEGAASVATLLGSVPVRAEAQLWTWALDAGDRYSAEADPSGWHEMILVTAGRLRIEREDGAVDLGPGEHSIYSSAQRYSYVNAGSGVTRFVRIVTA